MEISDEGLKWRRDFRGGMMGTDDGRVLLSTSEEEKWRARHDELGGSHKLADVFRGWIPPGFDQSQPRILYVGKATSGNFKKDTESECFNKDKGLFWSFARQIAKAVDCSETSLACIAWSNISKISCDQIRAEDELISGYEREAAATLKSEIAKVRPNMVVFVSAHFGEEAVRMVAEGDVDSTWNKSESESDDPQESDIWWKRRRDGIAVLWMRHPQGADMVLRDYAAAKIRRLVGT